MRSTRQPTTTPPAQSGFTLLELIMACAILLILATSALPVARYTVKRQKEAELRRDLREMRDAIDRYKDASDRNLIRVAVGTEGYPPDLQTLVAGVDLAGQAGGTGGVTIPGATPAAQVSGIASLFGAPGAGTSGTSITGTFGANSTSGTSGTSGSSTTSTTPRHVRFLRRIPVDPMTGQAQWGFRSVADDPDSSSWGGMDVFDVFSMSTATALDGTQYANW
jgi:general secretion pathway protein G